jgi:hypothetical protein
VAALLALGLGNGRTAELQVTNVEFISKGNFGKRGGTTRIACTGDVRRIEYREARDGLNFWYGDLYATMACRSVFLVPLDYQATVEVIRTIENKFLGLAEAWRSAS